MEQLTMGDFDLLIEALDSWESDPTSSALVGSMLSAVLIQDKEKMKETSTKHFDDAAQKVKIRKERSIILKAKLLQMRDACAVEELERGVN